MKSKLRESQVCENLVIVNKTVTTVRNNVAILRYVFGLVRIKFAIVKKVTKFHLYECFAVMRYSKN